MVSWSFKTGAGQPCYSGILQELPRVNKRCVLISGSSLAYLVSEIYASASSFKLSNSPVWVALLTSPVSTLLVFQPVSVARLIFMVLAVAFLLFSCRSLSSKNATSENLRPILPVNYKNSLKELALRENGNVLSELLARSSMLASTKLNFF